MPESSRVNGRPRMPKGKNVDWGKAISCRPCGDRAGNATQDVVLGSDQGSKFDGVAVVFAVMHELPRGIAKKMRRWRGRRRAW